MRKALKGLEKCAKMAVTLPTRSAKFNGGSGVVPGSGGAGNNNNSSSNTAGAPPAVNGSSSGSANISRSLKQRTRSLTSSTAFPSSSYEGFNNTNANNDANNSSGESGCKASSKSYIAAGMVFGLALAHRIINRYSDDAADKTQLLVRCHELNLVFVVTHVTSRLQIIMTNIVSVLFHITYCPFLSSSLLPPLLSPLLSTTSSTC